MTEHRANDCPHDRAQCDEINLVVVTLYFLYILNLLYSSLVKIPDIYYNIN